MTEMTWYERNREKSINQARLWTKLHPERVRERNRERYAKLKVNQEWASHHNAQILIWRKTHPEKVAEYRRREKLKRAEESKRLQKLKIKNFDVKRVISRYVPQCKACNLSLSELTTVNSMLIERRSSKEILEKIPNLSRMNIYRHRLHSGFNPTPRPIKNPEWKKLSYRRAYRRAWFTKATRDDKDYTWRVGLKRTYGLTPEKYWEMFEAQGGICKLCGNPPTKRRLCVDHDHTTGRIRFLLCTACNFFVGCTELMRRKSSLHQEALSYLGVSK